MQAILNTLFGVIRRNAKAIAAFVMSVIVAVALNLNVNVSPDVLVGLEALLVSVIVWLVPNRG